MKAFLSVILVAICEPLFEAKPNAPNYQTKPVKSDISPCSSCFIQETFQGPSIDWTPLGKKYESGETVHSLREHDWIVGDKGIKLNKPQAYHGFMKSLLKEYPGGNSKESLYATMETHADKKIVCSGSYFKLYDSSHGSFDDSTPYSIMFGPDRCGYPTNKIHFIIKHPNPSNPDAPWIEEHLLKQINVPSTLHESHQFGFGLHPNSTLDIWVDGQVYERFDLRDATTHKFQSPKLIPDPTDVQPKDWVTRAKIPEPEAVKPEDWDEDEPEFIIDETAEKPENWNDDQPAMIPNPDAEQPEDWDEEEDGEWITPLVPNPDCGVGCGVWEPPKTKNPAYKGKWVAPLIDNPEYKGPWTPKEIENPDHYKIEEPFKALQPFDSIGFELWVVDPGVIIDNIFITTDKNEFDTFLQETYHDKSAIEAANAKALLEQNMEEVNPEGLNDGKEDGTTTINGVLKNKGTLALSVGIPAATTLFLLAKAYRKKHEESNATKTSIVKDDSKKDDSKKDDSKKDDSKKDDSKKDDSKNGDSKNGDSKKDDSKKDDSKKDDSKNGDCTKDIRRRKSFRE